MDCTPAQTHDTFAAFVQAWNMHDQTALNRLVAGKPYFVRFSVSGAAPRLGEGSKSRSTLAAYLAGRAAKRDTIQVMWWRGGERGTFQFKLKRESLDELPSRYEGKGRVRCGDTNAIAAWSMARERVLPVVVPPARFAGGRSARIRSAGCGGCVQTETFWATTRYRDAPNELPPHKTMAHLAPDGLLVHVTRSWEPSPPSWIYTRRALTIVPKNITAGFEGNTSPRVSMWQSSTWRGNSFVTVWVMFGRPIPTPAQVRRAQRLLDSVRFPRWRIG